MNPVKATLLVLASGIAMCCGWALSPAQSPAIPAHGKQPGLEASNPTDLGTPSHAAEADSRLAGPIPDCNSNGIPDDVDISAVEWAQLTASDAVQSEAFGIAVAISGDVAVIGASGADGAEVNTGSAYVYRYDGSAWVEEAKLTASDAWAAEWFGVSVSVSGDTVVVGAYADNCATGLQNCGSAYVYRFDGSNWVEEA
ncbi:MAG: FG-GAP repeat protein, partial [Planctomycetes bacterium]|nr:FG-GAP repeat protein [Planctomycetota bacterium]